MKTCAAFSLRKTIPIENMEKESVQILIYHKKKKLSCKLVESKTSVCYNKTKPRNYLTLHR